MKIHSWNVFQILQARLILSNIIRNLNLIQQYFRFSRKLINCQNVEALNEYIKMYTHKKKMQVAKVMNFKRVYKDFLHVIKKLISAFAEIYNAIIDIIVSTTNYKV